MVKKIKEEEEKKRKKCEYALTDLWTSHSYKGRAVRGWRETTDYWHLFLSLTVLQQAACDDPSSFVCLTAGASLTEQIKLPPMDYTTSLLEHSSVIMTLHDSTLIRSDSPRWSQHPSVLQLAPPPSRRWEASVCKCWVWTINYVDFAYRGRNLTLFDTDFLKKDVTK